MIDRIDRMYRWTELSNGSSCSVSSGCCSSGCGQVADLVVALMAGRVANVVIRSTDSEKAGEFFMHP